MTGRAVMVRWIQVGHDDLLHRSEGMSGVSNLSCTPSQQTCQARKFPGLRNVLSPLAEWWGTRSCRDHWDMRNAGLKRDMEKLRMEAPEKSGASMREKGIRPSTFGTVHCALRGLALSRALSTTGPLHGALGLPRTLFTDTGRKRRLTLSMALS